MKLATILTAVVLAAASRQHQRRRLSPPLSFTRSSPPQP